MDRNLWSYRVPLVAFFIERFSLTSDLALSPPKRVRPKMLSVEIDPIGWPLNVRNSVTHASMILMLSFHRVAVTF